MSLVLTDGDTYIHISDHQHNSLTWNAVNDWWWACCLPPPYKKRIWQSEITVIPLWGYYGDIKLMAKKPAKKETQQDRSNSDFIGFVNITLNDDELAQVDAALATIEPTELPNHLDYLLDIGKISFNYNRGSLNATLTVLEGISSGYAVSAYSDTLTESLLLLRMKVQNYLDKFPDIYANGGTRKRRG